MRQPEVGDIVTVTFKGRVTSLCNNPHYFRMGEGLYMVKDITALEDPIEVGDTVWWDNHNGIVGSGRYGATLISIFQGEGDRRKWGVVAYRGDIPKGVYFSALRKTPECVD